jgi:hypothetical protein
MSSSTTHPQPPTQLEHAHDHVHFDFEKLDCYQAALQFNALAARLVPRGHRELRDQLTRASLSIVLNCAEAMGSHYLLEATACGKRGSWLLQVAEATSIRSPRRRPLVMWT